MIIDESLTWCGHLDLSLKKYNKCAAIVLRIRHFINLTSLKLIYYSLVYPFLAYRNITWGNTYIQVTS